LPFTVSLTADIKTSSPDSRTLDSLELLLFQVGLAGVGISIGILSEPRNRCRRDSDEVSCAERTIQAKAGPTVRHRVNPARGAKRVAVRHTFENAD
jgi:hypothetical protein